MRMKQIKSIWKNIKRRNKNEVYLSITILLPCCYLFSSLLCAKQNGRSLHIVEVSYYIQLCKATMETPHPEPVVVRFEETPNAKKDHPCKFPLCHFYSLNRCHSIFISGEQVAATKY
jgi:hypothetical protein